MTTTPPAGDTAQTAGPAPLVPVMYKIPEAMLMLRLSRSVIFEQLRSGRLRSVREGRARLIPATAIDEYVKLLEAEAARERDGQAAAS